MTPPAEDRRSKRFSGSLTAIGEAFRTRLSLRYSFLFYVLFTFAALRVADPNLVKLVRHKVFDFYQTIEPRKVNNFPVVIADIDEPSLKAYGQWPWRRTLLAELIGKLTRAGAIVIGIDVLFAEKDRLSPPALAHELPKLSAGAKKELEAMPANDTVFANAMRRSRVVLGISGLQEPGAGETAKNLPAAKIATVGGNPTPFLVHYADLIPLVGELAQAASGVGLVNIVPASDGVVRQAPALARVGGRNFLSLSIELLRVATGASTTLVKLDKNGVTGIAVAGALLPLDRNGQFWLHFSGHKQQRFISIRDFLEGKIPPQRVAHKIVLIGTTAVGLHDLKATPLDAAVAGVEVHAELIESILSNALLVRPNYATGLELMVLVGVGLLLIFTVQRTGAVVGVLIGGAVAVSLVGLSWYLFAEKNLLFDFTTPMAANFVLYSCIVVQKFYNEERSKRAIRSAFSHYLSPELVEKLAESPNQLVLGGETKTITIMFSDIRQFSTISEGFAGDPQALTRLMNRFLSPLSDVIQNTSGTIDKYIGDAIMAFWNAPLNDADHAEHACLAALGMVEALAALNHQLETEAKEAGRDFIPIRAGIGINSGDCVVGNLGSDRRFNYSALGDAVNLASRIEGLTKQYGVTILMGESTARLAPHLAFAEVDLVRVVGKDIPVRIYALLGDRSLAQDESFHAFLEVHETALQSYRSQEWADAIRALARVEELTPQGLDLSGLFATYRARIREYAVSPPPGDWDGVYRSEKK